MTVRTCTKVNIGLNVLRKRPDGYHDLETLFVPYWGFGDELTVEPAEALSIEIEREGGVDWDPMEDLTVRAWRLLKADFPQLPPVHIRLVKGAPVGAGLGGGSADAAFMLRVLNEIGDLGLGDGALASYAARLGSDCAFFIGLSPIENRQTIPLHPQGTGGVSPGTPCVSFAPYIRPMFGSGRGEILEPFEIDLSGYELRVEIPVDRVTGRPVAVSTREAYHGITPRAQQLFDYNQLAQNRLGQNDQTVLRNQLEMSKLRVTLPGGGVTLREALKLPVERWRGVVVNDFEATVCPLHPEIPALIGRFYADGAIYASMSGSGAAVFGLFK